MLTFRTMALKPNFRISTGLALATLAALGLAAGRPAAAQITVKTPVNVGTDFLGAGYGQDGYVIYDSFRNAGNNGEYFVGNGNGLANGNTIIVKPSYVTLSNASATYVFGGYGYTDALPGHEAGLAGPGPNGGNTISFTTGSNSPTEIVFGVLANYTNASSDNPVSITLTGPIGAAAVVTPNTATQNGYDYLFDIKGVTPNQTYTVSVPAAGGNGGLVSGVTFNSAPEPSQTAVLCLGVLGLTGLAIAARRRSMSSH